MLDETGSMVCLETYRY